MARERLFAYGTLNDPAKQEELFGRRIVGAPGALDSYTTVEIAEESATYLAAVPAEGKSIQGFLLEVTAKDLEAADAWEGGAYRRVRTPLRSGTVAWAYVKK